MTVRSSRPSRSGFTLTEVMFAVITLGIGLIMVAAIFPVAIQQRKLTGEETNGATIAQAGVQYMTQLGKISLALPATGTAALNTGQVKPLPTTVWPTGTVAAWNAVRGNVILATDPRFAWVPLYRRDGDGTAGQEATWSSTAQIFIVPVAVRNASTFVTADVTGLGSNLVPRQVTVDIANNDPNPDTITFTGGAVSAVVEGTYVIISSDAVPAPSTGRMNGRIYRVGNLSDATTNKWELMPGNDFTIDYGANGVLGGGDDVDKLTGATAYIVGRGVADPIATPPTYTGPAMDIAVYTGFVGAN